MSWQDWVWRVFSNGIRSAPETGERVENDIRPGADPVHGRAAPSVRARIGASATQYSGLGTDVVDLVVGFDFGTSCTKVVIRSSLAFRDRATAVKWAGRGGGSYLLPSVLHEVDNGQLELEPREGGDFALHVDLKTCLMDDPDSRLARARAAAYLGLALRAARRWFLETQHDVFGRFRLRWTLNMGIPSAGYDDLRVREVFADVARAGWRLSVHSDRPTLDTAVGALGVADGEAGEADTLHDLAVIPEVVAEAVGYAQSKHRRDGLHVIMDVGASTVDICGFILHSPDGPDGDDSYKLLTALVKRLGVRELHLKRIHAVESAGKQAVVSPVLGPLEKIPSSGRSYVECPSIQLDEDLDNIDEKYRKDCKDALMGVLMGLRKLRDPKSQHWETGLPVFVGGGGGGFELIVEAIDQSDVHLRKAITARGGIRQTDLAVLDLSNDDIGPELVGRLDVAWGLSFDSLDIGEISPPHRIPDVSAMHQRQRPEIVGKDQV